MGDANGYVIPPRYWAWLVTRRALVVLLWGVALAIGGHHLWHARVWFNTRAGTPESHRRADGNDGHAQVDFGGQWIVARLLVTGRGRELYHRQRQWEVVREGFPVELEAPVQREELIPYRRAGRLDGDDRHDSERLMYWIMGSDPPAWKTVGSAAATSLVVEPGGFTLASLARQAAAAEAVTPETVTEASRPAVGGPLYPPVHALLYAPLGLLEPRPAYALFQCIAVAFAYLAGFGVRLLTRGRVWWSVASIVVLLYPGTRAALDLGQNATLSLSILVWGWALASRNREWAGGAVWGLFAFKPVWGLAFFLVPVLMRRWRFCAAMVGTGAALALATLPAVGLQAWFDWLAVGREAAGYYNVNENWINLSRDLQGIPRRFLHDFTKPEPDRDTPLARALAWGLWGVVFTTTVAVYLLRADRRRATGLGAGFLFLGAFLCCYRFMYYDVLLSAIGFAVLLADPARAFRTRTFNLTFTPHEPLAGEAAPRPTPGPLAARLTGYVNSFPLTILAALFVLDNWLLALQVEVTVGVAQWGKAATAPDGSKSLDIPRLRADSALLYPWDTVLLLALWAWCALRLIRGDDRHGEARS